MDYPKSTRLSQKCAKSTPLLCGRSSLARGLCVKTRKECRTRLTTLRPIPQPPNKNTKGAAFGYVESDLGRGCYVNPGKLSLTYYQKYNDGEPVPDKFSCLSYNIWGLPKNPEIKKLFTMRKNILEKTISEADADIICLQEMSPFSYDKLAKFIGGYKFASEIPFRATKEERNRSVEVYFLSKYKPSSVAIYNNKGVLDYDNTFMVITYPNLVIFNLYNQAGSKHSPGQEDKWIHYSRCRYDILNMIYDMYLRKYKKLNCIICGDFNFHLDGGVGDWPEIQMYNKFLRNGFIDTYRAVYPDSEKNPGYTEDTDINLMRFNQKLLPKKLRYDAILYRNASFANTVKSSHLIGLKPKCLNIRETAWFLKNISVAKNFSELRKCVDHPEHLSIHPSDHFGLLTTFDKTL